MKILIITQYFPPEIGAPQNRLYELAVRIAKRKGYEVTVLTAMPNYPKMEIFEAYQKALYKKETMDGITVHRAWIYVSKSKGIVKRLMNYFSFVFTSLFVGLFKVRGRFDLIVTESPPLFLGISGYVLSKFKRAKFSLNVSDLWPESAEKLGLVTNKMMLKSATFLEEFLYRKSVFVTGQTQGIVKDIQTRFPSKTVYWLPNGVDVEMFDNKKIESTWRDDNGFKKEDLILLYAGILGHAQGLELIVKAASLLKDKFPNVYFVLMGAGPEKEMLVAMKQKLATSNVLFFEPVTKSEIGTIIKSIDAAIVPLKKMDLFLGAIPSKIFESLAMEKPIVLGVDGEARELFVNQGECAVFFEPENENDLAAKIIDICEGKIDLVQLGKNGRNYVSEKFNRNKLADSYVDFIESKIKVKTRFSE